MKRWLIIVSFFLVLTVLAYYIEVDGNPKDITPGNYSLKIIDSIEIADDISLHSYYAQNGYWIKMGFGKANFYEISPQHVLKASIRGATSFCPDPNKRISPKNLERPRAFGVGKNVIITYDDINERFYIYDKQGKLIRTLKTDLEGKKLISGCNYSQTNDTLVVISVRSKLKSDSLMFDKTEHLYHIIDLKTGKTLYKVGSFPDIYRNKKYLIYLPFHNFTADFKQKRIFYQCQASPFLYVTDWETGKTETFGVPCQNYTPPEDEIKLSSVSQQECYEKINEYRKKSYATHNLCAVREYIFRQFRLLKEGDLSDYVLQIYKSKTLISELKPDKKLGDLVYVSEDLSIWFEKNYPVGENNKVLYKTKLVPEP